MNTNKSYSGDEIVLFSDWLRDAREKSYAIPAINVHNSDTVEAAVVAAKNQSAPLILALAHSHAGYTYRYTDIQTIALLVRHYSALHDTPVVLHLDHGRTTEFVRHAIDLGFDSVMIDASEQDFQTNVETVKEIVDYAHEREVSVEAELGHVGKGDEFDDQSAIESKLTSPVDAVEFVRRTNIDALAVAFGTKHGVYKTPPKLNLSILDSIRSEVTVPLVMHGTSGLSEPEIQQCIEHGISKVNVFTEIAEAAKLAFLDACTGPKTRFPDALLHARDAFQERIEHYIQVCGAANRLQ